MTILTAAEMREVDRLTIEAGIPGIILMENAGSRVVDFLRETFAPLSGTSRGGDLRQGQQWRRRVCRRAPAFHTPSLPIARSN